MRLSARGAATREAEGSGVGASWPEVVRTAYLLTADHGTAEELAAAAFVQERRRRLARSPVDARRLVLTIPLSLTWQLTARSRRRPDPEDPFLAAFLGLSPRERALLVLRVDDGLDGPAAAATLGLRPKAARELTVTALDALRVALPSVAVTSPARHDPADLLAASPANELDLGELAPSDHGDDEVGSDPLAGDPVAARLAALFAELSAAPPVVTDPARRVEEAAARARRRRGRLAAVAAGLLVIVAGTGAVLDRRQADDLARQERAERLRAAEAARNPVVQSADVTTWPTRGDLAGRADLIAQVIPAAAEEGGGEVLAVPFLGEVGGLNVALAITTGLDDEAGPTRRLVALFGPGTAPVTSWDRTQEELDPAGPNDELPVPVLIAALGSSDGQVRTVAVTVSSGVSFAVSPGPTIDADGVATRRYSAVPLRNGVGTASWSGVVQGVMTRIQYGNGVPSFGHNSLRNWREEPLTEPLLTVLPAACRGAPFAGLRRNVDNEARRAVAQLGLGPEEIEQVRVVGCRRVADHALMFVGIRCADGTALQTVLEEIKDGDGGVMYVEAGVRAVPRGREITYPRLVSLWDDDDPSDVEQRTLLFAAPGGATAEVVVVSREGTTGVVAKARLAADGIGVATTAKPLGDLLEGAEGPTAVVVRDAAGRQLERVPVPVGHEVEPETPDGPVDPPADGPAFPHRR